MQRPLPVRSDCKTCQVTRFITVIRDGVKKMIPCPQCTDPQTGKYVTK